MIHIDYLSAVRLSGPDSGEFLQSQLSADIKALDTGQSTFAAYCTPRGQVLGLLLVCRKKDEFLLVGATELLPGIVQRLKIFVMRSKVEWADSSGLRVFGVSGDESLTEDLVAFIPSATNLSYVIDTGTPPADNESIQWKSRELKAGIAWLDSATTEKFIPQMLGQDEIGALSFSKGCYPGQEIVARTRYLGKVKRKPLIISVPGSLQLANGSKLEIDYPEKSSSGTLIDSADDGKGNTLLFVVTNIMENQVPIAVTSGEEKFGL